MKDVLMALQNRLTFISVNILETFYLFDDSPTAVFRHKSPTTESAKLIYFSAYKTNLMKASITYTPTSCEYMRIYKRNLKEKGVRQDETISLKLFTADTGSIFRKLNLTDWEVKKTKVKNNKKGKPSVIF